MKCSNVIVPGFEHTNKIKNPGLETKIERDITAYHSTDQVFKTFKEPEIGYHFAEKPELAHNAALKGGKHNPFEMERRLGIKNPLILEEGLNNGWYAWRLLEKLADLGVINDNEFNKYMDLAEKYEDAETAFELTNSEYRVKIKNMFKELLNSKGYDSIKYWNTFDAGPTMDQLMSGETSNVTPGWSYIVFSNKQIKTP